MNVIAKTHLGLYPTLVKRRPDKLPMEDFSHSTFLSPFTWRYGSREMREIFSEVRRRKLWRRVWLALAKAQAEYGLLSPEELKELEAAAEKVDIGRAEEIEREIGHDLMAELRTYAEQCPRAGGKLHAGATSMDIEDNADVLRFREAVDLLAKRIVSCLSELAELIKKYKGLVCMGYTHLQPAEPTTLGYRLCCYAQDLLLDLRLLEFVKENFLKGKGIKGAVGTSAGFRELVGGEAGKLEEAVMKELGIEAYPIASQTYPRKLDYVLLSSLSSLAQSLHKFASDLRHLQSMGEVLEPIGKKQVGSSAMPFKRNPVLSERICSLCRYVSVLPQVAWENAAQSLLERTLDDSANRRIILPEAFLALDECLLLLQKILAGLEVNRQRISDNLRRFAPFAATEAILMELVKRGHSRQEMHEKLRDLCMRAWGEVDKGGENPLPRLLREDAVIGKLPGLEEVLRVEKHVGDAEERAEVWLKRELLPALQRFGAT
jgi:adenylosuccinate lyase